MKDISTKDLFEELKGRTIHQLKENEVICPSCKGLKLVLGEKSVIHCTDCYTGKLVVCEFCGSTNKTSNCSCKEYHKHSSDLFRDECDKKEKERFEKSEKISYKDYDGYYIYNENVMDLEELEESLIDGIMEGDEAPEYLWTTESSICIDIDIKEIIYDKSEDGYEDMSSYLDMDSNYIKEAQRNIDLWLEEQGNRIYNYTENYKKSVDLSELVKKLNESISKDTN